ncbi:uncharacterized protein STEHIDRAFT_161976 [Stereum hirsutum FP-91666 SS1]|uniref:uncharacterized protein n=1 Tax=Stereum hirsutum (strain FP-91666) TaxID=721885 RepID=UPI000444A8A2|nr:uncharacterized protein STEHIDRAFT_161976 [Stereum hirsutum FP-91666 SS1]EIM80969.1 hypothetical protein STEHIDRAFT_161976 [Stereum hirsutum FP-91666 SS1]
MSATKKTPKGSSAKESASAKYELRDIVLGKMRGFPPWPGMVVDPESVGPAVSKEKPQNKKQTFYCVKFFPKGDHAWLVPKDMSRLQTHEIQAYLNEPSKRSGELLTGYKIALDPTKWEEEIATVAENEEVDQLGDDDEDGEPEAEEDESLGIESNERDVEMEASGKKVAGKKRKRETEKKGAATKGRAVKKEKKESAEPKEKKEPATKKGGAKKGTKSKAMVESEDEGEKGEKAATASGEGAGTVEGDDAGPSKVASPPAKKAKKDDDPMASDPEALKVREWRHRLQKTFLTDAKEPKPEDMPACDELFTTIEQYDNMNIGYLQFSKIGKVMRHIFMQPPQKIPRDDEFKFRDRANVLVEKWHGLVNANKEPATTATTTVTVTPATDGTPTIATATTTGTGAAPSVAVTTGAEGTVTASVVTENGVEGKENGDVSMAEGAAGTKENGVASVKAVNGDASMTDANGDAEKVDGADVVMSEA